MIRWHQSIASACLAVGVLGVIGRPLVGDEPRPDPNDPFDAPAMTEAQRLEAELLRYRNERADPALRKKLLDAYPFQSLEDRLAFDGPGRKRVDRSFPTENIELAKWKPLYNTAPVAKIPPATLATLMTEERLVREEYFQRTQALAALHNLEVRKFVSNPGFGRARLVNPVFLKTQEPPVKDWSEGDRGAAVTLPRSGTFFTPNPDKKGPTLPSIFALSHFHADTAHAFARPDSWGLVKDKKQVAGFTPHTMEYIPGGHARRRYDLDNPTKNKDGKITGYPLVERWAVRKVELVGLLVNESPVVYLNADDKLPTMAAVKDAKTRELTHFEKDGLKDLAAGKDTVFVAATTNQVHMVGAIRMGEACMKCHEGKQGDLLGAFTYDLVRDPAFIPPND